MRILSEREKERLYSILYTKQKIYYSLYHEKEMEREKTK